MSKPTYILKEYIDDKYGIKSETLSPDDLDYILRYECKQFNNPHGIIEDEYIKIVDKKSNSNLTESEAYIKLKRKLLEDIPVELFESFHLYTPEEIVDIFIKQFVERKEYGSCIQCIDKYCYVLISIIASWQVSKQNEIFKKA